MAVTTFVNCFKQACTLFSNCGCCKLCGPSWKYFKISILGVVSFFSVWGVFTLLQNVNEIVVDNYNELSDGIQCTPTTIHTDADDSAKYCDSIAEQMANSFYQHPEWQCDSYTDYSTTYIYDELQYFGDLIHGIFFFSALSNVCAIIHDGILVYRRENIEKIKMNYTDKDDFYRSNCIISYSSGMVGIARFGLVVCSATLTYFAAAGIPKTITSSSDKCNCNCLFILKSANFWSYLSVTYVLVLVNLNFMISWFNETKHKKHFLYLVTYRLPMVLAVEHNDNDPSGSMFIDKKLNIELQPFISPSLGTIQEEENKYSKDENINNARSQTLSLVANISTNSSVNNEDTMQSEMRNSDNTKQIPASTNTLHSRNDDTNHDLSEVGWRESWIKCCNFRGILLILTFMFLMLLIPHELIVFGIKNPYHLSPALTNAFKWLAITFAMLCVATIMTYVCCFMRRPVP
eukprot:368636_1